MVWACNWVLGLTPYSVFTSIPINAKEGMPHDIPSSVFLVILLFSEPLVGFEPTTPRLQITCSGQLS